MRTWLMLIVVAALPLVLIGDAPWINDEPQLFAIALDANAHHQLATHGLVGSVGMRYGPVSVWLYQALLGLTHNLASIAFLHALLMTASMAAALWWLARALDLWRPFAAVLLLSPYLWFYDRALWDNSLQLPLGALALAAFADYCARGRRSALVATMAFLAPMPLIHPMSVALVVPVAVALCIVARRDWRWLVVTCIALLALLVATAAPYLESLLAAHPVPQTHGDFASGFFFPLLGGQVLSAVGFTYFWRACAAPLGLAIACLTVSAYALVWFGLALSGRLALDKTASARRSVSRLALAVVATQAIIDGVTHSFFHPHYFNATWVIFALLAWLGIEGVGRFRKPIAYAHAAALAAFLLATMVDVHAHQGDRGPHYGATLANQLAVAEALQGFTKTPAIGVDNYRAYPQALTVLRALLPAAVGERAARVDYLSTDACDGRIGVTSE